MQQLIYTSIAAPEIDAADVFAIVSQAARNNAARDITGVLTLMDGRFLQAIEGPAQQLDELLSSLRRDPRHHSLKTLSRSDISRRQFRNWRMKRMFVRDQGKAWRAINDIVEREGDALSMLRSFETYLDSEKGRAS